MSRQRLGLLLAAAVIVITAAVLVSTQRNASHDTAGVALLPGLAAELVEHFELDGLVNVQFRSFEGRPALLEINSRPSGGLYQTALAGVNLPWAAVQVALGHDPGPLRPRLGAQYVSVSSVIPLTQVGSGGPVSIISAKPVEPLVATVPLDAAAS